MVDIAFLVIFFLDVTGSLVVFFFLVCLCVCPLVGCSFSSFFLSCVVFSFC